MVAFTYAEAAARFETRRAQTIDEANAIGTAYLRIELLEAAARPATLEEAEQLAIAPGAALFHLRRVRLLGGLPIAFDHSRVPLDLAPSLEDADFAVDSLYAVLEAADVAPARADYQVQAAAADASAAGLLDTSPGDPVLVTEQVTYDAADRPIELGAMTYRADRYRFRASLRRTTRREIA
jgi:GntR family transcriptional regulator